jgi:hypothetical protein
VALALPRFAIPWDQRMAFPRIVVDESLTLLSFAAVPFAQPSRWLVAGVLVALLVAGAGVRDRLPREDPDWARFGQWLAVAAAGVLVLGAGYALALLGGYGRPLSAGIENRVNLVSGAGYVMIIYSSVALAGHLLVRAGRRPPTWATAVPVAASVIIGIGYVGLGRESAAAYDRSFAEQLKVLHAIRDGGPYPPAALIFPFDYPAFTAVGVPVFAWIWDLPPASKIILDDPPRRRSRCCPAQRSRAPTTPCCRPTTTGWESSTAAVTARRSSSTSRPLAPSAWTTTRSVRPRSRTSGLARSWRGGIARSSPAAPPPGSAGRARTAHRR